MSTIWSSVVRHSQSAFELIRDNVWKPMAFNIKPSTAIKIGLCIEVGLALPVLYHTMKRKIKGNGSTNTENCLQSVKKSIRSNIDDERQKIVDKSKPPHLWNGIVIIFPDPSPEAINSPTNQLLWFFQQAKLRIQLCILLSSYAPIENVILEKIGENVLVQVITDYDTFHSHNNFNVVRWQRTGRVEVKMRPSGHLMHNKFAIIDEEAVLTGSLNWTKQGFTINRENVTVSTDYRIVEKYMTEYDRIWTTCEEAGS